MDDAPARTSMRVPPPVLPLVEKRGLPSPSDGVAIVVGALSGALAVPPIAVVWVIGWFFIGLHGGATLGGFGASPEPADAWWVWPALLTLTAAAVALSCATGWTAYRITATARERRRSRGASSATA